MANIEDIILRTTFDDAEAVKGLSNLYNQIGKTEKAFDDMTNESLQASKAIGKDLVDANQKAAKEVDNLVKKTTQAAKSFEDEKRAINDVALAIVKSGDSASKFAILMERIEKVKLTGAKKDVQDLEQEFTELLQSVSLTDDQIITLENNIEEVAGVIGKISGSEFRQLANDAQDVTGKFVAAKTELRQLTSLINSGQLTGEELQKATVRAAKLTDEIQDVRGQIKLLSSDTRTLDLFAESVNGIGAGFQIVEGSAALFGDESEDLQKTLVKLNAVMAIANGLQQAGNILTTRGGIATKIATGFQTAYTAAIGQGSVAMKVFRGALAATGVGLLVIGLTTLITNFDKVKEAVTNLFPSLKDLKANLAGVWSGIKETFSTISDVVSTAFDSDASWNEVYDKAKNIGQNVKKAFDEGFATTTAQGLRDEMVKEIEFLAKDQRKRAEILEAGGKDASKIIENAIANELAALRLGNAERQEIDDKAQELAVFRAANQKKINDEAEKARLEREKKISEANKKLISLQNELTDALSESSLLTDEEKFNLVKEKQIESLQIFRDELEKTAKVLGKDVSKSLEDVDKLMKQIEERKFVAEFKIVNNSESDKENDQFNIDRLLEQVDKRRAIQKREIQETALSEEAKQELLAEITLRGELERLQILQEFGDKNTLEYEQRALQIAEITSKLTPEVPSLISKGLLDDVNNFQDLFKNILKDVFPDIGEGEIAEFVEGIGTLVNQLGSTLNEANKLQIESIDEQLDRLSERREKAEDEFEKELEFQKEGLANNVGNKQAEVDGLLAQEERLLAERDKLQREQQRRQLIAETASQTLSLITASADIFKGATKFLGPLGLPIAVTAIAAMFSLFAATKIKAFQATKLHTGANRIEDHFGQVAPNGRSDIPGRGEGYRVIDAVTGQDTNVRISGREMLLPESVTESQKEFWQGLKSGRYNDVDIAGILELHRMNKKRTSEKSINPTINTIVNVPKKQWVSFTDKRGRQGAKLMDIPQNGTEIVYFDL